MLHQGVHALRAGRVLLVNRDVWRRHIERQPENRLTRCVDDVPDAGPASSLEHIERTEDVVVERGDIAQDARSGNRGQVHEPVEGRFRGLVGPGRGIVLAEERIDRLPIVREVDPNETRTTLPGHVKVDNLMSSLTQHGHNRAPQLARPTRDGDLPRCSSRVSCAGHSATRLATSATNPWACQPHRGTLCGTRAAWWRTGLAPTGLILCPAV